MLVAPTSPSTAFKFGEKMDDPLAMYMNDIATIPANLAGVPAMSIPAGLSDDGLPVGFQFIAPQQDRKSTRLNSSHSDRSRMPSSA